MIHQLADLIKNLEIELLQPDVRKNTDRIKELLADDFIEFGASGNKYTKNDILDHLPKLAEAKYAVYDFSAVQISPETIFVTYRVEKELVNSKEKTFSLRSSLWQNRNDNWQMFFHQGTPQKY